MRRPSEKPTAALSVLRAAVDALEAVGVTAWLTDGTLLGAVRERAFIRHDRDMDLGAHISEYTPDVELALLGAGFVIREVLGTTVSGLEHKLLLDGFKLDIFWHSDSPAGGVWHAAWEGGSRIVYEYDHLAIARLRFLGVAFWAPTPPKLHLVQKYGSDWRTPIEDWDWAGDPHNGRRVS